MKSFENTEAAFAYKSNSELKKAHFLFSAMGSPAVLKAGLGIAPFAIKYNLPFTKSIIRNTLFAQFVGGETLEQTAAVADKLEKYNVHVILDYGVEGGGGGEQGYNQATEEFIKVINYAATQPNIPFMSIKVTGIVRFGLLENLDAAMHMESGTLIKRYNAAIEKLSQQEKEEWKRATDRLEKICGTAVAKDVGVQIDAEETWIQDPIDAAAMLIMDKYNKEKAYIYNTAQLYRTDRLQFVKDCYQAALERNFIFAIKLVRGAYMEKERKRAAEMGYPSPIQPDKMSTDRDYDAAVTFCIEHSDRVAIVLASHNEQSNLLGTEMLDKMGLKHDNPHVHFSQLYGMSDHITFNLAAQGFNVSKYLPFGPIKDVVPYLMRRAQENSSVAGQTGRELSLLKKEMDRRKI